MRFLTKLATIGIGRHCVINKVQPQMKNMQNYYNKL